MVYLFLHGLWPLALLVLAATAASGWFGAARFRKSGMRQ